MTKTEWRAAREKAYDAGEYTLRVPDVTTGGWDKVAWMNWVRFNRPELNGIDDRMPEKKILDSLPVIFRKDTKDGFNDITAVFPTLPSNYSGSDMTCYAHVGQHSGCSREWYYTTKPAKPEEYADLLAELRQIYENPADDPVKLVVRHRITYDMDKARMAEAALYHQAKGA